MKFTKKPQSSTIKKLYFYALTLLISTLIAKANLLVNGSFESGDPRGWGVVGNVGVATPEIGAQDGDFSLLLESNNASSLVYQRMYNTASFSAAPGDEFNLSGYFLTEMDLNTFGSNVGLFKIVFEDAEGNHLVPKSVSIGSMNRFDGPGAESRPRFDSSTPLNEWIFSETQAVAPARTESVQFIALNIALRKENAAGMYIDNMTAVRIPEISIAAFFTSLAGLVFVVYRRCYRRDCHSECTGTS